MEFVILLFMMLLFIRDLNGLKILNGNISSFLRKGHKMHHKSIN